MSTTNKGRTGSDEKTVGEIVKLRTQLGITQSELSRRIGVKRAAESNWENGRAKPSTEMFVRLGNLAAQIPNGNFLFFWEQAGLDKTVISRLMPSLAKRLHATYREQSGNTVDVPLLKNDTYISQPTLAPPDEIEGMLPFSRELIPHPANTSCFRIADQYSHLQYTHDHVEREMAWPSGQKPDMDAPVLREGDIVTLDSSVTDFGKLMNAVVAVSVRKFDSSDPYDQESQLVQPGFYIGWLHRQMHYGGGHIVKLLPLAKHPEIHGAEVKISTIGGFGGQHEVARELHSARVVARVISWFSSQSIEMKNVAQKESK